MYCKKFKDIVVKYYNNNDCSAKKIIKLFGISNGSLFKWKKDTNCHYKLTRNRKLTPRIKAYIRAYVISRINFKYKLLLRNIVRNFGVKIGKTTLYNTINKLNITKKKISRRYIYKNKMKHKKDINNFKKKIKNITLNEIISVDECHFNTEMSSKYGWSVKGQRIFMKNHICKKERYTLLCGISNNEIIHYEIIKNSANGEIFLNFIKNLIIKDNNTRKYILLDNARIHHYKKMKNEISKTSYGLIYNIPYMPEYNPIEQVFGKIKNIIYNSNKTFNLSKLKNILKNVKQKELKNFYNKSLNC